MNSIHSHFKTAHRSACFAAILVASGGVTSLSADTTPAASATTEVPAIARSDPPARASTPTNLAQTIQSELEQRLPRSGEGIQVHVDDGRVTLRGQVEIFPDRERAQEIAEGVRGVREVVNQLSVVPATKLPDSEIARNIRQSLAADGGVAGLDIDVGVKNAVVILTGDVKTDPQRRVAGWLASRARGVSGLDNRLVVRPEPREDAEIQRQLDRHYATNALFDDDSIEVEVKDGVVRLSGRVDDAREKTWAQLDAWVPGVRKTDTTQLEVSFTPAPLRSASSGGGVSDSDIRDAIHQLYVFDPRIDSFKPEIDVRDRVVTLSGFVSTPKARQAAVQVARHTGGVVDVIDRLEVRSPERQGDDTLARILRSALRGNAVVDAKKIEVEVENGRAILSGEADDAFAKWTAGDIAERTRGIVAVENKIKVVNEPPLFSAEGYFYPTALSFAPWFPTPPERAAYRSDAELMRKVRTQLTLNPFTDALAVDASAERGIVTLRGQVESSLQRRAAAGVAYQAGAKDVINQLRVARH